MILPFNICNVFYDGHKILSFVFISTLLLFYCFLNIGSLLSLCPGWMRCNLRHHILLCFVRGNPTLCCLACHPLWQCRDVVCCGVLYCTVPFRAVRRSTADSPRGSASSNASALALATACRWWLNTKWATATPVQSAARQSSHSFPRLCYSLGNTHFPSACLWATPNPLIATGYPMSSIFSPFFSPSLLSGGLFRLFVVVLCDRSSSNWVALVGNCPRPRAPREIYNVRHQAAFFQSVDLILRVPTRRLFLDILSNTSC